MAGKLEQLTNFTGRKGPLVLAILDGMGIAEPGPANAISLAKTPTLDGLFGQCPLQRTLLAHGPAVGLPSWNDIGNSEVGHNALGAGRVFDQGAKLVSRAIDTGEIFKTTCWRAMVEQVHRGGAFHFIGLLSDGNVHSHIDHLFALMRRAAAEGVKRIAVHALLDGRDVDPQSSRKYVAQLESVLRELESSFGCSAHIASGGGRMVITMDRYNADWDMVDRGWQTHVLGQGRLFTSAEEAIETAYREKNLTTDQFIPPFVIGKEGKPVAPIVDGDSVLFFNFRGDRAIEISRAFEEHDFDHFDRVRVPRVKYAGLMQYDGDLKVPNQFLVTPPAIEGSMSVLLCELGMKSFAISETQKYGHVTFFWNGNRSGYFDEKLETYVEIPSDNLPFDQAPAMKAAAITEKTIDLINSGGYSFGRVNFPNGDMVGHTGNLEAAVAAAEEVDRCLGYLLQAIDKAHGVAVVLADHGNSEQMFTVKDGVKSMHTAHTTNPVPFFVYDPGFAGEYRMAQLPEAGLANVAATLINLLGYQAPADYEPSLITFVK